jgi:putative cell wall-binding protein
VITLTLDDGASWATAPTASGTPSVTVGAAGANALTVTLKADAAAGNTIVLKGAKISGAGAGAVTATLTSSNATLTLEPSAQVASIVTQARLGGADRYGTASLVFNKAGFTSSSVILTSGTNFPDALSAQYLAKALSTAGTVGILTTDPNNLTASTKTVLTNGTIDTVYIVGGAAAVSANVANQVAALHVGNVPINANLNVIRIAGADRYATNNAADLYLGATGGTTHAYIATGANFADALAIGPVVYKTGDPLILTDSGALNANAKSTLQSLGITDVTIVGGTSAVSTAVETALTNMGITIDARLAGADRTQTAAAIATDAVANQGFNLGTVYIARGDSFADALVAGPLAGLNSNPILLTQTPTTLGAGIPSVLSGQAANVTNLTALGLTSAVSVGTLNAAAASLS